MNCYNCKTELIWGGDSDVIDDDSEYSIVTNFSCPKCNSFVLFHLPKQIP